jgi:phenylalanyl-tRNA synthetase alpha chain
MEESILDKIQKRLEQFNIALLAIASKEELEFIKNEYIGKEGFFSIITEELKNSSIEKKKLIGSALVDAKKHINGSLLEKKNMLFLQECHFPEAIKFDPSLEKKNEYVGVLHPYTISLELINNFFIAMGFEIIAGKILTNEYNNFTSLNIPKNHPAREEQDTFWIDEKTVLRTHTSNIQVEESKKKTLPFGIISSGLVYRNEATDMSHDFMFAQIEGVYFGESASISSLLYVLKNLLNVYFEKNNLEIRARPGIFPFVEPGLEIDFECPFCLKGCSTCSYSGWIEIGGAGMVHEFVKKEIGLDAEERGWAFGMGLTRMVMLKYNITDIRKLHQSLCKV